MDHSVFIRKKQREEKRHATQKNIIRKIESRGNIKRGGERMETITLIKHNEKKERKKSVRELNKDYYTFYILNYFEIFLNCTTVIILQQLVAKNETVQVL